MWKLATLDYTMNSTPAAAFHLGDTLSTLLPVDAVLEIRRTSVLREHGAGQSVAGLDISPRFLNRSKPVRCPGCNLEVNVHFSRAFTTASRVVVLFLD
jgi:hypothetical protein